MKAIEGREAKLEVAKMKLERESKLKNTSTHHKDCQTDGYIDVYDSVTPADEETGENMNQVTSESPVNTGNIQIYLEPQGWKKPNMDPTILTTMRLNADTSATTSPESTSTEQEPARFTLSERLFQEILKGLSKLEETHQVGNDK